jgi:hypothetical protein
MRNWSKDELRKMAEADDLHVSPFRKDAITYGNAHLDSVGRSRRRSLGSRLLREFSLVSGCGAKEGRADYRRRHDEGSPPLTRSKGRSTTASTTPTGKSTMAARISARWSANPRTCLIIGKIHSGVEVFDVPGLITVTVEPVK